MLPLAWIDEVAKVCKELKLPLHCDGARLFNSAAALNVPVSELVKHCDSVSVCLSKGLGKTQLAEVAGVHNRTNTLANCNNKEHDEI